MFILKGIAHRREILISLLNIVIVIWTYYFSRLGI